MKIGCAHCRNDAVDRASSGAFAMASDEGLRLVAAGSDGPAWAALYLCASCGAYRRAGVFEASKDYHSAWLPIESPEDLAEFAEYLHAEASAQGTTERAIAEAIVARGIR